MARGLRLVRIGRGQRKNQRRGFSPLCTFVYILYLNITQQSRGVQTKSIASPFMHKLVDSRIGPHHRKFIGQQMPTSVLFLKNEAVPESFASQS